MESNWSAALFNKLKELQNKNGGILDVNHIDTIIEEFLGIIKPFTTEDYQKEIYYQIEMILVQFLALKRELSSISTDILEDNFVPNITMDLRSVVIQTERSVTGILDIADEITHFCQKVENSEVREELIIKSTRILELCNFQDLTGQRIQKIIHHLGEAEPIIYKILHILHPEVVLSVEKTHTLVNGPQNEENAPSQSDIDALFNNL